MLPEIEKLTNCPLDSDSSLISLQLYLTVTRSQGVMDCGSDTLDSGANFLTSWLWVPEQVATCLCLSFLPSPIFK